MSSSVSSLSSLSSLFSSLSSSSWFTCGCMNSEYTWFPMFTSAAVVRMNGVFSLFAAACLFWLIIACRFAYDNVWCTGVKNASGVGAASSSMVVGSSGLVAALGFLLFGDRAAVVFFFDSCAVVFVFFGMVCSFGLVLTQTVYFVQFFFSLFSAFIEALGRTWWKAYKRM